MEKKDSYSQPHLMGLKAWFGLVWFGLIVFISLVAGIILLISTSKFYLYFASVHAGLLINGNFLENHVNECTIF